MMSEVVRYEIKNFITWTLDFENWHKKIRVGPYSNEHEHWSWLIWLKMEMLKIRPRTDPPNVLQCDLKKMEEY